MPSIVSIAYEPYWKKIQQLSTIAQNEVTKQIPGLAQQAQQEAAMQGQMAGGPGGPGGPGGAPGGQQGPGAVPQQVA